MSYRIDAAAERVYLASTLPTPSSTGRTIMGWFRIRVDRNDFSTYWRTSNSGTTVQTCATDSAGLGVNLFTPTTSLSNTYSNAVDQWVHIATVETTGGTTTQYVTPDGGSITSQSGSVTTGTADQICIGGRLSSVPDEWGNLAAACVRVFASALSSVSARQMAQSLFC